MNLLLLCTSCIILRMANTASVVHRPNMVSLADFTRLDMKELDYLENLVRNKRSGDLIGSLKSKIGQGIKSKLGLLSKGSSHHSSYHHPSYHEHDLDDVSLYEFRFNDRHKQKINRNTFDFSHTQKCRLIFGP